MEIKTDENGFLPTSRKEMDALGWENADIILFTGDAYIDHPAFGTAVIARVLQREGYRVAVVPQPNWRDDWRDFRKLGRPRLFFGVNSGAMDSMVNHYTAARRLRSNDAYTPGGAASFRPDYAVKVYTNILKDLYPDVPVVIGGIEASLRRLTHYDYWQDRLLPSILIDSKADFLIYGMGEKASVQLAHFIENGSWRDRQTEYGTLRQVAWAGPEKPAPAPERIILHSYEKCLNDKKAFAENAPIVWNGVPMSKSAFRRRSRKEK